jgi:hypothetical protein
MPPPPPEFPPNIEQPAEVNKLAARVSEAKRVTMITLPSV